jgi:phospholipid/cholesterol/gamma-HCH transport system permease protein
MVSSMNSAENVCLPYPLANVRQIVRRLSHHELLISSLSPEDNFAMEFFEDFQTRLILGVSDIGRAAMLTMSTFRAIFKRPYEVSPLFKQLYYVGVKALPVVLITGTVVGLVSAVQAFYQLKAMSAEGMMGGFVAISVVKELAPMLAAFVMAARVGTGFAAELGTMKVTEQIDALRAMAISPVKYLVVPRVLACALMLPILIVFADVAGIMGGLAMSVHLGLTGSFFIRQAGEMLLAMDVLGGLIKGFTFGIIMAVVGCYRGMSVSESAGAEGVGVATSSSAVNSFIAIIIADFILNYGIYAVMGV